MLFLATPLIDVKLLPRFGILCTVCTLTAACSGNGSRDAGSDTFTARRLRETPAILPSFFDASVDQLSPSPDADLDVVAIDVPSGLDVSADRPTIFMDGQGGSDAPPVIAPVNVRFVHAVPPGMAPPPAVDICVRSVGAMNFTGPLLEGLGFAPGLSPLQVTRYLSLPSGSVDILLVASTALDCSTPILPPLTNVNVGMEGEFKTVVLSGIPIIPDGGVNPLPFRARVLNDLNPTMGRMGGTSVRVFNSIPSPARFDVGIVPDPMGNPDFLLPLFYNVAFGETGRPPPMGGDGGVMDYPGGYYPGSIIPAPGATVGLRATCATTPVGCMSLSRVPGLIAPERSITTAILALELPMGAMAPVSGAILCRDSDPPVAVFSACVFRRP